MKFKRNYIYILPLLCLSWLTPSNTILGQETFTLQEAIDYALEHSQAMKLDSLDIQNADHIIRETKAIGIPKIEGGIDYKYYFYTPKQPVEDFISPTVYGVLNNEGIISKPPPAPETFEFSFVQPNQLNATLGANTLLFDGTYLVGLRASKVYKELAKKKVNATKEQIYADVTKAYVNVLITELNQETLADNIENLSKSLHDTRVMYEEGFVGSLDVDRLQLSYDQLVTQQENLEQIKQLAYNLLKFQMNYNVNEPIVVTQNINELIEKFNVETDLENIVIDPTKRAQYQLLESNQKLNKLDVKRYKAGYLPSVVGLANFQYSLQRSDLFDNDETGFLPTLLVGFNIRIPIYDGGEKSAKIQQAKVKIEKNRIQQDEFARGMNLQANNALISILNAKRNVKNKKNTLDMTESIYDRTKVKFVEGVGSSVEVTQAESALYQAQADYTNALYELLQAKIDLDLVLGDIYNNQ